MKKLTKIFFETSTAAAAKQLLGKYIVRRYKGEVITAKIVETEAYTGTDDPGSHACRKITPRNKIMFGPAGAAYVYFCYGSHYLFNIVTEKKGRPGAVLIRACEPVAGIGLMQRFR
ncbi:MAG: DNA-3-methyladenine glycosylase, partial [bacterium]